MTASLELENKITLYTHHEKCVCATIYLAILCNNLTTFHNKMKLLLLSGYCRLIATDKHPLIRMSILVTL